MQIFGRKIETGHPTLCRNICTWREMLLARWCQPSERTYRRCAWHRVLFIFVNGPTVKQFRYISYTWASLFSGRTLFLRCSLSASLPVCMLCLSRSQSLTPIRGLLSSTISPRVYTMLVANVLPALFGCERTHSFLFETHPCTAAGSQEFYYVLQAYRVSKDSRFITRNLQVRRQSKYHHCFPT